MAKLRLYPGDAMAGRTVPAGSGDGDPARTHNNLAGAGTRRTTMYNVPMTCQAALSAVPRSRIPVWFSTRALKLISSGLRARTRIPLGSYHSGISG